ncbi:L,D-transpeptidase ErfK/SrfK [Limimonas halophila]|uniref:L,D-transpeptidase ErfK/SrfK n=1 Tax=Limimonas halophila TaxID=1082479 RepID=A0A1G7P6I8_9PROT|nr:L,D-transpeptidase family protein [Limimonas halophila]SDF81229.1 L,D-transpeptidase ErfK/SrfK [Limimonas halophila]
MTTSPLTRRRLLTGSLAATAAAAVPAPAVAMLSGMVPRWPEAAPVIGTLGRYTARHEDTLLDVARRFGLGYTEMVAANRGVDPWLPGEGTELVLPTAHLLPDADREGLVLNLADQRVYRFRDGVAVASHPVGIGRQGWSTPTGRTEIVAKTKNPVWRPPESIREENPDLPKVVPAGDDNPLGHYKLDLGWPTYLFHGTNMPWGIGRRVSHGCVRLYPEDIARFFDQVAVGTPVQVVDQPAKLGWVGGTLLLEVHPNQEQASQLARTGSFDPAVVSDLPGRVVAHAQARDATIDWPTVDRVMHERRGIPEPVARPERRS